MLNILRWYALCENVHRFYLYYRPISVTVSVVVAAPAMLMWPMLLCVNRERKETRTDKNVNTRAWTRRSSDAVWAAAVVFPTKGCWIHSLTLADNRTTRNNTVSYVLHSSAVAEKLQNKHCIMQKCHCVYYKSCLIIVLYMHWLSLYTY